MKNLFAKAAFVAILAAPLALAACSSPTPSSSDSASQSTSAEASTSSSAATSGSTSAGSPDANGTGPVTNPKSEFLVGMKQSLEAKPEYAKISDACKATVTRFMVGISAPLAVSMEEMKSGNIQKSKDAIAEVQGTTPAEFEPVFKKLEAAIDQPAAEFDQTGFETMSKPVSDWMAANCSGFGADS